ncbi:MAG: non-hydrolyzing UDP-N-acetylglucosamine 2-epimerase [Thermoguttaceae bacterium]
MGGVNKRISILLGTRPEGIKLCPLVTALRSHPHWTTHVCVTGQHREMLTQVLKAFDVEPDVDLGLMRRNQTLGDLTSRAIAAIDGYLRQYRPDMVVVQGDTTTVFCASLCAFYHRIPLAHVEAGLRTGHRDRPFPEEMNRVLTSRLVDLHFAPTETARQNLLREQVPESRVVVTGNTVIDAMRMAVEQLKAQSPEITGVSPHLLSGDSEVPIVLITGHRRENFGRGLENLCGAVRELSLRFPETHFFYPVHLNPNVRKPVYRLLGRRLNIHLTEPLNYLSFIALMSRAKLVLTDSGGVQEEAPCLGKPVLVLRETTERPEGLETGTVRLVGIEQESIVENVVKLLTDETAYSEMARVVSPYGDGLACSRIVSALERYWEVSTGEPGGEHARQSCHHMTQGRAIVVH